MVSVSSRSFLGKRITRDYIPSGYAGIWGASGKTPRFTLRIVGRMLTDPRVSFGLRLIKGPILSKSRFFIKSDDPLVKEFIIDNVSRFWMTSASRCLKALDWGFSCSEVLYRILRNDDLIHFDTMTDLLPTDCRAVTREGELVGSTVRNTSVSTSKKITLPNPRSFWHVHDRSHHPWYGRSRLFGAYLPWLESWTDGGYRDSRRLFFHKYAYSGGVMYHPGTMLKIHNADGSVAQVISAKDLAREMMEKLKTGGSVVLPNDVDEKGNQKWRIEPPQVTAPPTHIMEYGKDLKDEIWEGMGIPPEVARAEGTGSYAGRRIPEEAFYSTLHELSRWLIYDFDNQVLKPLIEMNFGSDQYYEITLAGLRTPSEEEKVETPSPPPVPAPLPEQGKQQE